MREIRVSEERMPRSKREVAVEQTNLSTPKELEGMDRAALMVQKGIRLKLLREVLVGTLYPRIVQSELDRIEELLTEDLKDAD